MKKRINKDNARQNILSDTYQTSGNSKKRDPMANRVFDNLLIEKVEQFKGSFLNTSKSVFYDESKKKLIHTGDYKRTLQEINKF